MGVAGLLSFLREHFPASFVDRPSAKASATDCDHLYIDMNSMLHQVVRQARDEWDALRRLRDMLHELTWLEHRPRATLTLALDGPAPLAKLHEQQQRRLSKGLQQQKTHQRGCSSLAVTVGTAFMRDVDAAVREWAESNARRLDARGQPRYGAIVFDPSSHAGEGEVKLFGHLGRRCSWSDGEREHATHLVLSGDADLILLALASPARRILILDPSSSRAQGGRLPRAFSTEAFRRLLHPQPGAALAPHARPSGAPCPRDAAALDVVLLALFSGNDYLRSPRGFKLLRAIRLYQSWLSSGGGGGGWLVSCDARGTVHLDLPRLGHFLAALVKEGRGDAHDGEPDPDRSSGPTEAVPSVSAVCAHLSGLLWCLTMYVEGACPSYAWLLPTAQPPATARVIEGGADGAVEVEQQSTSGGGGEGGGAGAGARIGAGAGAGAGAGLASLAQMAAVLTSEDATVARCLRELVRCPRSDAPPPSALEIPILVLPAAAAHLAIAPLRHLFAAGGELEHLFSYERCAKCARYGEDHRAIHPVHT